MFNIDFIPKDQLTINQGTYAHIKSEYTRRYSNYGGSCGVLPEGRREQVNAKFLNYVQLFIVNFIFFLKGLSPMRVKRPLDLLKLEGDLEIQPEYPEVYVKHQVEKQTLQRPTNSFQLTDDTG